MSRKISQLTQNEINKISFMAPNLKFNTWHELYYQVFFKSRSLTDGLTVARIYDFLKSIDVDIFSARTLEEDNAEFSITFEVGDKVTFVPEFGKKQQGIIKGYPLNNAGYVFVVFGCNNDWDNFANYTGQSTDKDDLIKGWWI